jgi:glucose-6-phosphate isomerase
VFITDPEKGALRRIAREESVPALDIPPNVGGRFSVLSAVGLLPAALIGIDIQALMAGAADMAERCAIRELRRNPAALYAMLQWLSDTQHGLGTHVIMPYSDNLRDVGDWFVQLWAESLGKRRLDGTSVGPTPIPALGATDQHSQVQLFMEGPLDKTVTFIAVGTRAVDIQIPTLHPDVPELAYLGGHSLGELLDVERQATAGALARRGRPNMTMTCDTLDAWHVGSMLMMLAISTVIAGALYEVNPLDQPGVELGKRYTYGQLGRPDAEDARREWDALPKPDPRSAV